MTIQDQYLETFRQTQETWADVMRSFTNDMQRTFGQPSKLFGYVDPNEAIDQVFDFWEKSLEVQRDWAKQFVGASIYAGEKVREQAESVGTALREQADNVSATLQSAADAARAQAAKSYDSLTKAELQEELGARDLPKTGTVDELRERLVADDKK
jgi:hypothetical protein